MTSPADLHEAALARLRTIPHLTVYDGRVPDDPPADDGGRVYGYAVLWPDPGSYPHAEADTIAQTPAGELAWAATVTVAAGTPGWCLKAVAAVRGVLLGHRLTPTTGLLREDPIAQKALPDPDTKPARWFVPLRFPLLTA